MLVNAKLDDFGAIYSSGRGLSCSEVECALRVFLRSSDTISVVVRKHREGS